LAVAAAATVAVAAVAVAGPGDGEVAPAVTATPAPTSAVPSPSTAAPSPSPAPDPHSGDVDGDGIAEQAFLYLEMPPDKGRWGIDVALSSGEPLELAGPVADHFVELVAVVDVNADGRAELVVRLGEGRRDYLVAILVGRHLEWVHLPGGEPLRLPYADGTTRYGWGCAEETADPGLELYTVEVARKGARHLGTRTRYVLDVSLAVNAGATSQSWSPATEPEPPDYRAGVACGTLRA